MSHRFVTVRRGSPAARCGQIQPGDQLEEVEGRPVSGLHHRDLAQILRRAGNTLRLSITPQHRSASSSEGVELDIDGGLIQGSNQRSKHKSRFYGVDLERGPTGFGFSLRGGSEYNMGLYVLGLMDGGPAQRSNKIKVSDQLVEINSESTAGMTHSQAVEQIRRGGQRIRLVLKKGNGYVPDYDPEIGAFSLPSFSSPNKEQRVVSMTTTSLSQWQRGGGERGETKREMEANRRTRRRAELGAPALDLDHVEQEMMRKEDEAEKKRHQEERRAMTDQEQRKNVRLNKQEERSFHRHRVPSLGSKQMVETLRSGARERGSGKARSRRRRDEDENSSVSHHSSSHHAKYSGSLSGTQRAVFSFLMPMKDLSDSESACSFSEVSLSTASTVTWRRQNYDQRRDESPMCQENMPGRWLKLNAQKLT